MDFVTLDEFLDDIMPEVPGCSVYTVQDCVRKAAIDFCKETGASVETIEGVDLDANEELLTLPAPSSYVRVWQLLSAEVAPGTGRTFALHRVRHDQVRLDPVPDTSLPEALTVRCSYIPTRNAARLDAVLADEWREAIVCGALERLLRMSKEAWYDPSEARERGMDFAIYKSEAKALAHKNFETTEQRVQMRPMA